MKTKTRILREQYKKLLDAYKLNDNTREREKAIQRIIEWEKKNNFNPADYLPL